MKLAFSFAFLLSFAFSVGQAATQALDVEASKIGWVGAKVVGKHHGTLGLKSGTVEVSNGKVTGGEFVLDMTSIKNLDLTDPTYNAKLVGHLKSEDFFAVESHPTGAFKIKKVVYQRNGKAKIAGELTLKGITKDVQFDATIKAEGSQHTAQAKFKINRLDWDLKYNSGKFFDPKALGDKMIYDDIEIEIDLKTTGT